MQLFKYLAIAHRSRCKAKTNYAIEDIISFHDGFRLISVGFQGASTNSLFRFSVFSPSGAICL